MIVVFYLVYFIVSASAILIMVHYELEIRKHKQKIELLVTALREELNGFREQTEADLAALNKESHGKVG